MAKNKQNSKSGCPYRRRLKKEMTRHVSDTYLHWMWDLAEECERRRNMAIFPYDDGTGHIKLCPLSYGMLAARCGVGEHSIRAFLTQWSYMPNLSTIWSVCTALGIVVDKVREIPSDKLAVFAMSDYQSARLTRMKRLRTTKKKVTSKTVVTAA